MILRQTRTTRTDFALVFLAGCSVASSFLAGNETVRVVSIQQADGITQDYWVKSGSRQTAEIQRRIDGYGTISIDKPVGVNRWIEEVSRFYASSNSEASNSEASNSDASNSQATSQPDGKQLSYETSGNDAGLKQVGFIEPGDSSRSSSIQVAGTETITTASEVFNESNSFSSSAPEDNWAARAATASRRVASLQRLADERSSQAIPVPVQWGRTIPSALTGFGMLLTMAIGLALAVIFAIWKRFAPTLVLDPHIDGSTQVNETSDLQLINPAHQRVLPLHLKPEWIELVQPLSVRFRRCFTAILILSGLFASIFA